MTSAPRSWEEIASSRLKPLAVVTLASVYGDDYDALVARLRPTLPARVQSGRERLGE